jgi:CMP-N,N'-diacetyllegionaminic acid synthase
MKITAIIPARSGSKRIINKNIKLYADKPLIYWSINIAKQSKYINHIVVSTDSQDIADIATSSGADVPFLRPHEISQDLSTDFDFIKHYIDYIPSSSMPDLIVQLRPTYPNRTIDILDDCISTMIENFNSFDSLRTVCESDKPPYKMYNIINGQLVPLFYYVDNLKEPYNLPAQLLPKTYWHNGYIDIIKPSIVLNKNSITGNSIYPYIMDKNDVHDIDTMDDWNASESAFLTYNLLPME